MSDRLSGNSRGSSSGTDQQDKTAKVIPIRPDIQLPVPEAAGIDETANPIAELFEQLLAQADRFRHALVIVESAETPNQVALLMATRDDRPDALHYVGLLYIGLEIMRKRVSP